MSEDYTPFKMRGNPFTSAGVQGTNSHVSALKKRKEKNINELLEQRKNLKEKEEKLKDKKFLGNLRRKRNLKKQEKTQEKINLNPTAQQWRKDSEKKSSESTSENQEESFFDKIKNKAKETYENIKDKKRTRDKEREVDPGILTQHPNKKFMDQYGIDHPDGYSRGQESSFIDKVKKGGSKILDLLKKSNRGVTGPIVTGQFIDKNKDGKDDRQGKATVGKPGNWW